MNQLSIHINTGNTGARISLCQAYRYRLWRVWDKGPQVAFVMLNPSTADALLNDATTRKCIGFAKRWGYSGIQLVNLFAFRATSPKSLYDPDTSIVGRDNDAEIIDCVRSCETVICAWGNHGSLRGRDEEVLALIRSYHDPMALAITKKGQPKHPLYISYKTPYFKLPTKEE